jgi:hypothetical protein
MTSFVHYYTVLNEYYKCNDIKNTYLQCLQNESNSKACNPKLAELINCIQTYRPPPVVINKDKS